MSFQDRVARHSSLSDLQGDRLQIRLDGSYVATFSGERSYCPSRNDKICPRPRRSWKPPSAANACTYSRNIGGSEFSDWVHDLTLDSAGRVLATRGDRNFHARDGLIVKIAPGTASMSVVGLSVNQSAGVAAVIVDLSAPSPAPLYVDYATVSGAIAGLDYQAASGTLDWPSGDADSRSNQACTRC